MKNKIKQIVQRIIRIVGRIIFRKHIWLISDRKWEAGDNGEAFFKYLQTQPVNSIFAVQKTSKDYERIKKIGKVVDFDSLKYKIFLCVADVHASSHDIHMSGHKETPQVFLSHGISYRDVVDYYNSMCHDNFYTVVASDGEKQLLTSGLYKLKENQVAVTGYPRYDLLETGKTEKIVTLALSWRSFLYEIPDEKMARTNYYTLYSSIFSNEEIVRMLGEYGYIFKVKLHPRMQRYKNLFSLPKEYSYWDDEVEYREIFEKSALIISDYSSVVFDFAYINKPVIYYQPDYEEMIESGETIYCYDYEEKGVGDVCRSIEELISNLRYYLSNGCVNKEKYADRKKIYFKYLDRDNCKRVYEEIQRIIKTKH